MNLSFAPGGSSPLVRGALREDGRVEFREGIIPARAGSTVCTVHHDLQREDHPRSCGEHVPRVTVAPSRRGSSPLVRGAPFVFVLVPRDTGIIPARAGSTSTSFRSRCRLWDHPRSCGEHQSVHLSVPLMMGSSPLVRGAPVRPLVRPAHDGIIPARAGSTACQCYAFCCLRDHPRSCGEHSFLVAFPCAVGGSSPLVRGALHPHTLAISCKGIIPARAGSTWRSTSPRQRSTDHPRSCGEHRLCKLCLFCG